MIADKLILGTAQMGMKYGIANGGGMPDLDSTYAVFDAAWENGISVFDTAGVYGEAECRIGSWCVSRGHSVEVVDKIPDLHVDGKDIIGSCRSSVERMLKKLLNARLRCILLHSGNTLRHGWELANALDKLRSEGYFEECGVSVYDEEELRAAEELEIYRVVQAPVNAFDHRLCRYLRKNNGIRAFKPTIMARSVFLQGLLLMEPCSVKEKNKLAAPYVASFRKWCDEIGCTPPVGALAAVLADADVDRIVVGVDNVQHLLELFENAQEATILLREHKISIPNFVVPESVRDPRKWLKS